MIDTDSESRILLGINQILIGVNKVLIVGMGGGGDTLTALPVRWALEKIGSHVTWIHGGITRAAISHITDVDIIDGVSAWVTEKSHSKPPHRLIEAIIAKRLKKKVFLLSCEKGVQQMIKSLDRLVVSEGIEMIIFIDGGTDSLAFIGSSIRSPTEDTMALAALGLGNYNEILKHRVAGVAVVGSDYEMKLDEIGKQLMKISMNGGYIGGTFFPAERLHEYADILSEVLQEYPTVTTKAPLLITNTYFTEGRRFYQMPPVTNGFQLATFLFDAQVAAEVGNDFTRVVLAKDSADSAEEAIFSLMRNHK